MPDLGTASRTARSEMRLSARICQGPGPWVFRLRGSGLVALTARNVGPWSLSVRVRGSGLVALIVRASLWGLHFLRLVFHSSLHGTLLSWTSVGVTVDCLYRTCIRIYACARTSEHPILLPNPADCLCTYFSKIEAFVCTACACFHFFVSYLRLYRLVWAL